MFPVCVRECVCLSLHANVCMCVQARACMRRYVYMCACARMFMYMLISVCTRVDLFARVSLCTCTCARTCIQVCAQVCSYASQNVSGRSHLHPFSAVVSADGIVWVGFHFTYDYVICVYYSWPGVVCNKHKQPKTYSTRDRKTCGPSGVEAAFPTHPVGERG